MMAVCKDSTLAIFHLQRFFWCTICICVVEDEGCLSSTGFTEGVEISLLFSDTSGCVLISDSVTFSETLASLGDCFSFTFGKTISSVFNNSLTQRYFQMFRFF